MREGGGVKKDREEKKGREKRRECGKEGEQEWG